MADAFDLQRFVEAQGPVWAAARAELAAGQKRTHWMWFVFPQIAGLGTSAMSQRYAIASLAEAQAYLAHPVLGPRLREAAALVLATEGRAAHDIFGSPDDAKLRSSLTLFERVSDAPGPFAAALDRFYGGARCDETLARLSKS